MSPHQSTGELGDGFMVEQFSHAETARPWDAHTKIAFCPQGHLPLRTGRVWASCVALHPHTQVTLCSTCTPVTRRRGLCRLNSDISFTAPLSCFAHEREFAGKKLRGSLTDHRPSPSQIPVGGGQPEAGAQIRHQRGSGSLSRILRSEGASK